MSAKDRLAEGYTVVVGQDEDAPDPRDDDNLGIMVCFHRRLRLGDKHEFKTPDDFKRSIAKRFAGVVLPLYLYDHGCLAISTESFRGRAQHAEWDSGQVGWIYAPVEKIRENYGKKRISLEVYESPVKDLLRGEVEYYNKFLQGDFSSYQVFDPDQNCLDSGCGFSSPEEAEEAGLAFLEGLNDESKNG